MKVFHGSNNIAEVLKAVAAARSGDVSAIQGAFHVAPKQGVAHNYGKHVAQFVLESDVEGAHVGMINKADNHNAKVGGEVEIVMESVASKMDFAEKVVAINVFCPDGRVAEIDIDSGAILRVA